MRRLLPLIALTLSATALADGPAAEKAESSSADRVRAAAQLPAAADALRESGVAKEEVGRALEAGKKEKVSPKEMKDILDSGRDSAKEHGPVDNFGAFVQGQLAEGKRGQDLAAAIRAEHEARGKKHQGGKPEDAGKDGDHGKPADKGADKGQPANKGGEKAATPDKGADKGATKGADKGGERKGAAPADNKSGGSAGGAANGGASKGGGRK